VPGGSPLRLGARHYRGQIQVQLVSKRLQAVNVVGLDAYLRGVVSEEMPDDWPIEAVKAQAVAARSYALSQRQDGGILYADVRSQVYGGVEAESPLGDAAVAGTRNQVLLYQGKVATAYYFSSSGGRTASAADVFSGGKPVPYLVSVPDPDDTVSPYHVWGPLTFTGAQVSSRLAVRGVTDVGTMPAAGRAREIVVRGSTGETVLAASAVRRALELRSTWVSIGVLSLSRTAGTVAPGSELTISGVARRLKGAALEQRVEGGAWEPGPSLAPDSDGGFTVTVTPAVTTYYRLVVGDVRAKSLRVPVA
jgi:stage II sporulation protein D